jgi:hypothetical protein
MMSTIGNILCGGGPKAVPRVPVREVINGNGRDQGHCAGSWAAKL